jgi:hypothetical protein
MQHAIENGTNLSVLVGQDAAKPDTNTRELSFDELSFIGGGEPGTSIK